MPYALVDMVPNATPGPFGVVGTHPLALDYDGNAIVLSDTTALAWTPSDIPDTTRARTLCDDRLDTLGPVRRAILNAILPDRTIQPGDRFRDIIGNALKTPPPGRWRPLVANMLRQQHEIFLGPGNFFGAGNQNPGLLWSEPADTRGPHSVALVDTMNRANGAFNGSTSSDGLFTWTTVQGVVANTTIVSSQCRTVRTGADDYPLALGSVAMDTADAYAQTDCTLTGPSTYCGPLVRNTNGTGGASGTDTGYYLVLHTGTNLFYFFAVNPAGGADVLLSNPSAGGATGGSIYLQVVGSTYMAQRDGVTIASGTDTMSPGTAGHRKVGFLTAVETNDTSIVDINNFFAGDSIWRPTVIASYANFPKEKLRVPDRVSA